MVETTQQDLGVIHSTLARVRRRVFVNRLLRNASLDLSIFVVVYALVLLGEKIFALGFDPWRSLAVCGAMAVVVTLARSFIWGRVSLAEAAENADERLDLKERVATAIYLEKEIHSGRAKEYEGAWGELIIRDGASSLDGAAVGQHFPVRPPKSAWWIMPVAAVPFLIAYFVPAWDVLGIGEKREAIAQENLAIDEAMADLEKKLEDIAESEPEHAPDFRKLLEKMREHAQSMAQAEDPSESSKQKESGSDSAKRKALVALSKREEVLNKELSADEARKLEKAVESLNQAKSSLEESRLTRRLRQELKKGDFKKALKELDKLKKDLNSLAKNLKDKNLSEKDREKMDRLRRQLEKELSKLSQDAKAMGALSKALAGMSSSLGSKNMQGAMRNMQMSQQQLQKMLSKSNRLQLLRQALQAVKNTKQNLGQQQLAKPHKCPDCGKPKGLKNPWKKKPGQKPGGT